jgi:4'-phosphopantetheinyl transferase
MPDISKQDIHLWLVRECEVNDPVLLKSYLTLLSDREIARYERLRLEQDKKEFLLTQVLARTVLAGYLDIDNPGDIRFERNPHGKPFLPGDNKPQFNLTNSNGVVVLAVTAGIEIGIDIEYLHRKVACLNLARRYFTPEEADTFEGLSDVAIRDRFFDFWTLKEAWLKAYGTGLKTPLNTFGFTLGADNITIAFTDRLDEKPDDWSFMQFEIKEGYRLSVSVKDSPDMNYRVTANTGIPLHGFSATNLEPRRSKLR